MTNFVTPKFWQSATTGQYPTIPELEKYRTNLTHFDERYSPANFGSPASDTGDDKFNLVYVRRYLVYRSRTDNQAPILEAFYNALGTLTDPDDTEDDLIVSLPATANNEVTFYDLSQISWMYPGLFFAVKDVRYAFLTD